MTKKDWKETVEITIPFHDVDSLNIVWHGHYLKYFEIARCALLKKINYDVPEMTKSEIYWPVVQSHCKYSKPAFYNDTLIVSASISEYLYKLKINYEIRNKITGQRLTKGYTVQVPVCALKNELLYETPKILLDKLGVHHDS